LGNMTKLVLSEASDERGRATFDEKEKKKCRLGRRMQRHSDGYASPPRKKQDKAKEGVKHSQGEEKLKKRQGEGEGQRNRPGETKEDVGLPIKVQMPSEGGPRKAKTRKKTTQLGFFRGTKKDDREVHPFL